MYLDRAVDRAERVEHTVHAYVGVMAPDAEYTGAGPPYDISLMTEPVQACGISGRKGEMEVV